MQLLNELTVDVGLEVRMVESLQWGILMQRDLGDRCLWLLSILVGLMGSRLWLTDCRLTLTRTRELNVTRQKGKTEVVVEALGHGESG